MTVSGKLVDGKAFQSRLLNEVVMAILIDSVGLSDNHHRVFRTNSIKSVFRTTNLSPILSKMKAFQLFRLEKYKELKTEAMTQRELLRALREKFRELDRHQVADYQKRAKRDYHENDVIKTDRNGNYYVVRIEKMLNQSIPKNSQFLSNLLFQSR